MSELPPVPRVRARAYAALPGHLRAMLVKIDLYVQAGMMSKRARERAAKLRRQAGSAAHMPQPMPDSELPLRIEAVLSQTAQSARSTEPMPLKQVVSLMELINQPILPAELLRVSEEELLAIHQGLRRFANICADAGSTGIKL